jgi:hypothetical protein
MKNVILTLALLQLLPPLQAVALDIGTTITPERAAEAADLLLPGVVQAVRQGMQIEVGEYRRVNWREAYKLATEKYQGQARLGPRGELLDYVAGLPFLELAPEDPQVATKIMWNYTFGPWGVDDAVAWSFEWETGHISPGLGMSVESGEHRDSEQSKWLRTSALYVPPLHAFPTTLIT